MGHAPGAHGTGRRPERLDWGYHEAGHEIESVSIEVIAEEGFVGVFDVPRGRRS